MSDPEGAGGFVNPEWLAYSEVCGVYHIVPLANWNWKKLFNQMRWWVFVLHGYYNIVEF